MFSPVRSRSDKLCDRVRKCRMGTDMEHWERIFAVIHATGRQNDRDKMYAGIFE